VRIRVRGAGLRPFLNHEARERWRMFKAQVRRLLPEDAVARLRALRKQLTRSDVA
jgi:hypothetical protein